MNLTEKLLRIDRTKLEELKTGEMEIERLSNLIGEPFMYKFRAITGKELSDIQAQTLKLDKKGAMDMDMGTMKIMTIMRGTKYPDLKDQELQKHFGAASPKELVEKLLLLPGEMDGIYNEINNLSGLEDGKEAREEVKN